VNVSQVLVKGTLKADGSLELDERPSLPPGRVHVIVMPEPVPAVKEDTWSILERIWRERHEQGMRGRTADEVDVEIKILRNELEEHLEQLDRARKIPSESRDC
jgi:hypothetical protein